MNLKLLSFVLVFLTAITAHSAERLGMSKAELTQKIDQSAVVCILRWNAQRNDYDVDAVKGTPEPKRIQPYAPSPSWRSIVDFSFKNDRPDFVFVALEDSNPSSIRYEGARSLVRSRDMKDRDDLILLDEALDLIRKRKVPDQ